MSTLRSRFVYAGFSTIVILLGLASRHFKFFPLWLGDILWALMVFMLVGFLFKSKSSLWIALAALAFSFCIEISQLYYEPWIDAIRATKLGGLVLGHGFLWSDLFCYMVGVAIGFAIDLKMRNIMIRKAQIND